jgi:hypothetical protein
MVVSLEMVRMAFQHDSPVSEEYQMPSTRKPPMELSLMTARGTPGVSMRWPECNEKTIIGQINTAKVVNLQTKRVEEGGMPFDTSVDEYSRRVVAKGQATCCQTGACKRSSQSQHDCQNATKH